MYSRLVGWELVFGTFRQIGLVQVDSTAAERNGMPLQTALAHSLKHIKAFVLLVVII